MRAEYSLNPERGAGYGLVKIFDSENISEPVFIIKRMSDGKYLSGEGWRDEKVSLVPESSNAFENGMEFHVGPNVVNELDSSLHYQLELPGFQTMPLGMGKTMQSWTIGGEGIGLTPPPLPGTIEIDGVGNPRNTIYEGVQRTPEDCPAADVDELPSGVASGEAEIVGSSPKLAPKKRGCLVVGAFLFAIWIVGAWFLWEGAKNAPVAPSSESVPFVLFPLGSANDDPVNDAPGAVESKP